MSSVLTAVHDGVCTVTLSDPGRRNALTLDMVNELVGAFDNAESRPDDIGAMVVTGAPPAFCAGADLSHLGGGPSEGGLRGVYEGFLRVARSTLPTIAAVNGAAVGAGMNLALACDLRLAGRSARFDTRFLQLGLHPGGGHTWMLHRLTGPQTTAAAVLFGEVLDGEAAERHGLAWRCVDDGALLEEATLLASRAAGAPRSLVRRVKETLRAAPGIATHDEAVATELTAQLWSMAQPFFEERLEAARHRAGRRSS